MLQLGCAQPAPAPDLDAGARPPARLTTAPALARPASATEGPGRIVWHTLVTPDSMSAEAFYDDIVGWRSWPSAGGESLFVSSQGPVASLARLPDADRARGAPAFWSPGIVVDDVDRVVARARALGGRVFVEPLDDPGTARFAWLGDPRGRAITVLRPTIPVVPPDPGRPGQLCCDELDEVEPPPGPEFYLGLFEWRPAPAAEPSQPELRALLGPDSRPVAAVGARPPLAGRGWVPTIRIRGLEAALIRAQARGAHVLKGAYAVAGGRAAAVSDPQGAPVVLREDGERP